MANISGGNIIYKVVYDTDQATKGVSKLDDQIKDTTKSTDKFGNTIKGVGAAIGAAFAAQQIVGALKNFGAELFDIAKKAEGIRAAFNRLNDPNLLRELRKATRGTVSDLTLMQTAVKAANFKLPLQELGGLLKFAQRRARETGESVEYLSESIVLGISRKSIPILDNLGLSAVEIQEEFKKTGDFAEAVGNIISREMSGAGEAVDSLADKADQLTANMENIKLVLAESLTPALATVTGHMSEFLSSLTSDGLTALEKFGRLVLFATGHAAQYTEALKNQRVAAEDAAAESDELTTSLGETAAVTLTLEERMKLYNAQLKEARRLALMFGEDQKALREEWNALIDSIDLSIEGLETGTDNIEELTQGLTDKLAHQQGIFNQTLEENNERFFESIQKSSEAQQELFGAQSTFLLESAGTFVDAFTTMFKGASEAEKAFFLFNQLLAVSEIFINLRKQVAAINASFAIFGLAGPALAAPLIARARIDAALGVAGVLSQAVPKIKGFAKGTKAAPEGMALVGEEGPELVMLPGGAQVMPAPQSKLFNTLMDTPTLDAEALNNRLLTGQLGVNVVKDDKDYSDRFYRLQLATQKNKSVNIQNADHLASLIAKKMGGEVGKYYA